MELAIDTSTATAGAALSHRGVLVAETTWRAGYNHTTQLYPVLEALLRLGGVTMEQVTGVIVAQGPGTFSGLRVGVSAAKGIALSRGIPLAAVSTLAVEAYPHMSSQSLIRPVLDAGRGELVVGAFRVQEGELVEVVPPSIVSLEQLCASIRGPTLFCGEYLPAIASDLARGLGPPAAMAPPAALVRRPAYLAALGWQRLVRGQTEDIATLEPVYLRGPSITKPRDPAPVTQGHRPTPGQRS